MMQRGARWVICLLILGACVASLIGTGVVLRQAPHAALWIFGCTFAGVGVLCTFLRHFHWGYAVLAASIAVFGCGLYWLHLRGTSSSSIGIVMGVLVMLPYVLFALGSGDPYEDD